jgi:hypothetical protein
MLSQEQTLSGLAHNLREGVEKSDPGNTNRTVSLEKRADGLALVLWSFDGQNEWPTTLSYPLPALLPYTPFEPENRLSKTEVEAWIELVIGAPEESGMDYSEFAYEVGE